MKGKIIELRGEPEPHSYIIEDEDGKRYFAHIGSISKLS